MNAIEIQINESTKTYATRKNLMKALERCGLLGECIRFIVVNEDGRWTAIFLVTEWMNQYGQSDATVAARHGFLSI